MRELVSGEIEFVSGGLVQKMGWPYSSNGGGGSSNGGGSNAGGGSGTNALASILTKNGNTAFIELVGGAATVLGTIAVVATAEVTVPAAAIMFLLGATAATGYASMIVGGVSLYAHRTA